MRWLPLVLVVAGCADELAPISSKVTLDDDTWTAAAYVSDGPNSQTVNIYLTRSLDAEDCAATAFDLVELMLPVGDRSQPHDLETADLAVQYSGYVAYTDPEQNTHAAIEGLVWPGRTEWSYSAEYGHNVIAQLDGEFDVTLPDGHALSGAFSAAPCVPRR